MSSSFFFLNAEKNQKNSDFLNALEAFSDETKKQIYVIDSPLGDSKYSYEYSDALVLLVPNHKIVFIDFGQGQDEFEDFVEDFVEDLGSISDKYKYKNVIGRPRSWKNDLISEVSYSQNCLNIEGFLDGQLIDEDNYKRKCELLISLLTGSINDIEKVKGDVPDNILDKVKRKIILFDGDQTRFVYQKPNKKTVTVQGLSGTGKTELLLHKLKEIYTDPEEPKIIFTCHNKILADTLRSRIPDFFDFMKVEQQILWDKRLWCVNAWGSQANRNSGAYSYITHFYEVDFLRYSSTVSFDYVCTHALSQITQKKIDEYGYAFDYMLVDESQDFPKSFFELCEKVTKTNVYIAGDIFQCIFDTNIVNEIQPDFLLSKCYRTDPRTLMFAHALGMGLFETPKLNWLEDKEWKACGYVINKGNKDLYRLTREPLRRFEDLKSENIDSVQLVMTSREEGKDSVTKVIEIIRKIQEENPTVAVDDIGVIFIDSNQLTYASADKLELQVRREFGWRVNKSYESKEKIKNTLFVSNRNNVKGLEFPFVICVSKKIQDYSSYRNALYMMLTRSFIQTHLLISEESNNDLVDKIQAGLEIINKQGCIEVQAPTDEEQERIKATIKFEEPKMSYYDFVHMIFDDIGVLPIFRKSLYDVVKQIAADNFDYNEVREIAQFNYGKMNGGQP